MEYNALLLHPLPCGLFIGFAADRETTRPTTTKRKRSERLERNIALVDVNYATNNAETWFSIFSPAKWTIQNILKSLEGESECVNAKLDTHIY